MKNEDRSQVMRAVKSRDTKPEMLVRSLVHRLGFRFRLHRTDLPGKPDLVFINKRRVIFVHGCFWHGHTCARGARVPKTNREYWVKKVAGNKARDCRTIILLKELGWSALIVWECETQDPKILTKLVSRFLKAA
jgi:DNA mismatch endonuclease, patch repair protein